MLRSTSVKQLKNRKVLQLKEDMARQDTFWTVSGSSSESLELNLSGEKAIENSVKQL